MIKRKILVIENQWIEFNDICKTLTEGSDKYHYQILLGKKDNKFVVWSKTNDVNEIHSSSDENKESDYISLATKIRIWVNKDYEESYRKEAFQTILELAKRAELIIMDHILGGSYTCYTGIDLAEELVFEIGIDKIPPVLFLSKTESNEKKLLDRYDRYYIEDGKERKGYKNFIKGKLKELDVSLTDDELKNKVKAHTMWVHKGYFGDEILQPEYIRKYVIEEGVEQLMIKSDYEMYWSNLNKIIDFYTNQKSKGRSQEADLLRFINIKKQKAYIPTQEQMDKIAEFSNLLRSPIPDASHALALFDNISGNG
jgi:hypothetical protein